MAENDHSLVGNSKESVLFVHVQRVAEEARRGNPEAASRRIETLSGIQLVAITEAVVALSKALIQGGVLPPRALDDALHIALSAFHDIDYLLTWNCRHIDNAETKPIVRLGGVFAPHKAIRGRRYVLRRN